MFGFVTCFQAVLNDTGVDGNPRRGCGGAARSDGGSKFYFAIINENR